jgi:hypothetical protein
MALAAALWRSLALLLALRPRPALPQAPLAAPQLLERQRQLLCENAIENYHQW